MFGSQRRENEWAHLFTNCSRWGSGGRWGKLSATPELFASLCNLDAVNPSYLRKAM